MSAHEPGPWWTTDSGVRNRAGYICHTNPAPRYEGQEERFAKESAERASNKVLIAAAPELLEALSAFVNNPGLTETERQHKAIAAVAKATGAAS